MLPAAVKSEKAKGGKETRIVAPYRTHTCHTCRARSRGTAVLCGGWAIGRAGHRREKRWAHTDGTAHARPGDHKVSQGKEGYRSTDHGTATKIQWVGEGRRKVKSNRSERGGFQGWSSLRSSSLSSTGLSWYLRCVQEGRWPGVRGARGAPR